MKSNGIEFGTGGFRGVIGEDFCEENVRLLSYAISLYARSGGSSKPIAVAYDHRQNSEEAASWICSTLNGNGFATYLIPYPVPTPTLMHLVKTKDLDFGIMVTASHNPARFNGMKLVIEEGRDADCLVTKDIESLLPSIEGSLPSMEAELALKKGLLTYVDALPSYLKDVASYLSFPKDSKPLKVLYDNLHGVGAAPIKSLNLYGELTILHEERDPSFGGFAPNPTREILSSHIGEAVVLGKYDYGMGTDSDSDRLGIIDEKGHYVSANEILACLYYYLIQYRHQQGDIVKNLATSNFVDAVAEHFGYRCHTVDVGFKNITAKMSEVDALMGGESSGGLTVRGYLYGKDSVFSSSLFANMVADMDLAVSKIVAKIKKEVGYSYHCEERELALSVDKARLMEELTKSNPSYKRPFVKIIKLDRNYKYVLEDGSWMLIRFSGTEPALRVFTEMKTKAEAVRSAEMLLSHLNRLQAKIK